MSVKNIIYMVLSWIYCFVLSFIKFGFNMKICNIILFSLTNEILLLLPFFILFFLKKIDAFTLWLRNLPTKNLSYGYICT
jgi:hypothetical protein